MIYEPVTRFGVGIDDWPLVFLTTFAVTIPFWIADTKFKGFPIWYFVGITVLTISSGFFAWARIGKPRRFAHHLFTYLTSPKIFEGPAGLKKRTWMIPK
jgi:hypothetical protein